MLFNTPHNDIPFTTYTEVLLKWCDAAAGAGCAGAGAVDAGAGDAGAGLRSASSTGNGNTGEGRGFQFFLRPQNCLDTAMLTSIVN